MATKRQLVAIGVLSTLVVVLIGVLASRLMVDEGDDTDRLSGLVSLLDAYVLCDVSQGYYDTEFFEDKFTDLLGFEESEDDWLIDTAVGSEMVDVFMSLVDVENPARSYQLEMFSDSFAVVRLYDINGEMLPPPIGFWYSTKEADGRQLIDKWYMCRLLPFSRYDAETAEEWYEIYS